VERFHQRCNLNDHERFEELASLAPLGELSLSEHEEFLDHLHTCNHCREVYSGTSAVAEAAFVVGSTIDETPVLEDQKYRRARQMIARRLGPAPLLRFHLSWTKTLAAAGAVAAFIVGVYVGGSILQSGSHESAVQTPAVRMATDVTVKADVSTAPVTTVPASISPVDLIKVEHELEVTRNEKRFLLQRVQSFDQNLVALTHQVGDLSVENKRQAQEYEQTRAQLAEAKNGLAQAQATIQSDQATIAALQAEGANREAQFAEVKSSVDRERQMLSADREIRDIMTARDLHMVDVVDTDGKGHVKKAFGRAFYTEGKSLIFYAYDLPANKVADGKFVFAAWGSDSNKLHEKKPLKLGIFYADDQSQHRWVMKFEDPKVLQEIDTVFVTLEPDGHPFTSPSGKPILDAYFGTPPNHP
jgi:hypothetical protein